MHDHARLANCIGCDKESVSRAMWWMEFKANGMRRNNGKFLDLWERRLQAKVFRLLTVQRDYFIKSLDHLSAFKATKGVRVIDRKGIGSELDGIVNGMPGRKDLAKTIMDSASIVMKKGADTSIKKFQFSQIGISFTLKSKEAYNYLSALETLHLSDYKGSIDLTTKKNIIDILSNGMNDGDAYTEMASKIRALSEEGIFSYARAQRIAVNEIHKAYQAGAKIPMQDYTKRTGEKVWKRWITVGDAASEDGICDVNENQEYIPFEEDFASGDSEPPGHINCRCDVGYELDGNMAEDDGSDPSDPANNTDLAAADGVSDEENVQNHLELADGTTISVPDGYVYHSTPDANVDTIAADGLTPHVSQLDSHVDSPPERVYLATNPAVAGSGLAMDRGDGQTILRVPAGELTDAQRDPHIPGNLSVYVTHDIPADVIQTQDDNGHWVPLKQ